jgi:hypothetical protein
MQALFMALLMAIPAQAGTHSSADLNRAAGLYYQARYDSALAGLEGLLRVGPWKKRDSLVLFQYLGMSSAKLGRDSSAEGYFASLLSLDSLFRFPKNEDSSVLADFRRAREKRAAAASVATIPPVTPALPLDSLRASAAPDTSRLAAAVPAPASPPPAAPPLAETAPRLSHPPAAGGKAMSLGYGAIPFGAGWMIKNRFTPGAATGLLQAAGLLLSAYASQMQSRSQDDRYGLRDAELPSAEGWQWTQRISFSVAIGAYLYSIFASTGE